jgi:hypothetical protein
MGIPFTVLLIGGLLFVGALVVAGGWLIVVHFVNRQRDRTPPDDP